MFACFEYKGGGATGPAVRVERAPPPERVLKAVAFFLKSLFLLLFFPTCAKRWLLIFSSGQLIRNRNYGSGWISYVRKRMFYANVSIKAPELLIFL